MRALLAALLGLVLAAAVAATGSPNGCLVTPLRPLSGGNQCGADTTGGGVCDVTSLGHSNAPLKIAVRATPRVAPAHPEGHAPPSDTRRILRQKGRSKSITL